ncbi:hypothetical protein ACNO8X_22915 [Mycobacterium sp. PDNC021]|uniref:hypothetical protein n=1 Tax=Mycobacterium sp. PDNC021 TaxID=3391399 RepID=UPI003AB0D6BD
MIDCFSRLIVGGPVCAVNGTAMITTALKMALWRRDHHGSPFRTGPLRTLDDVEYPVMQWVHSYNNRGLHSPMDYIPPVEYESAYYARLSTSQPTMSQT